MKKGGIMLEIIIFLVCFILVYLLYYIVVISRRKKLDKLVNSTECLYLKTRYQVDVTKIPIKTLANHLALTNAFIMALTVLIISIVDNWILKFVCGFFVLMILILIFYHFLGRYYQKKQKEEKHEL